MVALVFTVLMYMITFLVGIIGMLIKHMSITNSLVVSALLQWTLTYLKYQEKFNWKVFLIVLIVGLILQGLSKIARVIFALLSAGFFAFIGYIWMDYPSKGAQIGATIGAGVLALLLSVGSFMSDGEPATAS